MKPIVICHMITSLDGRLHPSGWTKSPDGTRSDWSDAYEQVHEALDGDAWLVGRVTMAEISKAEPHPPVEIGKVERPSHFATRDTDSYAIALDPAGKLHFKGGTLGDDAIVVLLGSDVTEQHLAELTSDGVSYLISETPEIDLATMLDALGRELGIRRLLLEGGAKINGAFFAAGLVDELSIVLCPALDGRPDSAGIVDAGMTGLAGKAELSLISCEPAGHGSLHLRYAVRPG